MIQIIILLLLASWFYGDGDRAAPPVAYARDQRFGGVPQSVDLPEPPPICVCVFLLAGQRKHGNHQFRQNIDEKHTHK